MMNAIIYSRVSSKEQVEGTSLESQQLACMDYAKAKGFTVLRTFIEQGESAKFADRTKLLELIDFCRENKGRVNILLVWKVDRFARNVADHFQVKSTLQKYGVTIVSVTEPIDTNPEGKLMETILAGFAQFDNDVRAMRTIQGMRRKISEGITPWKPPLGYRTCTARGERKNQPDVPDEPNFSLLQKAWLEYATGAYTKAEIRRLLDSYGIRTDRKEPLCAQGVDKLFRNRYYAGTIVDPWSGTEYPGRHMPMVSTETFARVQRIISRRHRSVPHQRHHPDFPLRGLLRCSGCSHYLTGSSSRGRSRRYAYYHCRTHQCERFGKALPAAEVHVWFEHLLTDIAPKENYLAALQKEIPIAVDRRNGFLQARNERIETNLSGLNQELAELVKMRARNLIDDDEFISLRASIDASKQETASAIQSPRLSLEEIKVRLRELIEPLRRLTDTWHALSGAARQRFQRIVAPVGLIWEKVGTADLGLIFRLNHDFADANTTLVTRGYRSWNQLCDEIIELSDVLREAELLKARAEELSGSGSKYVN